MKKKSPITLQFIFNCFSLAVLVNSVVSTTQILHTKHFSLVESIQIFLFTLGMSALFFAAICIVLYLLCLLAGMGREKTFWLLMIVGITMTIVAYIMFKESFYKYTNESGSIAAIAAFSIMISLASQYQFFHSGEHGNKNPGLS